MKTSEIEKQVLATMEFEGAKPSRQGKNITHLFLTGKIDSKTAISQIIKFYVGSVKK